ncbi:polyhydroxyalkanoate synthesis regulator DNA-binding domain-containing protein [Tsukamurella soli]|uniref:PHA accumulation regulator DNA-binding N-terminal domain-containing protein n=1 Tax=Tsukamurella soli TaxID=644556 RepID=A0ABP8JCC2_9ACTN
MADDDPYLIKRYSNRKLYDSVRRRFTTLDEIAGLLDLGTRVVVRDHDSGIDRTDEVLAQLLRRRAQSRPGGSNLLSDLLRAPADVAQNVVGIADFGRLSPLGGNDGDKPGGRQGSADQPDDASSPKAKSPKAKKKSNAKPKGKAKSAENARSGAPSTSEQQQAEIQELRQQVSQLTQAVTLLLQEKTGSAATADDED